MYAPNRYKNRINVYTFHWRNWVFNLHTLIFEILLQIILNPIYFAHPSTVGSFLFFLILLYIYILYISYTIILLNIHIYCHQVNILNDDKPLFCARSSGNTKWNSYLNWLLQNCKNKQLYFQDTAIP